MYIKCAVICVAYSAICHFHAHEERERVNAAYARVETFGKFVKEVSSSNSSSSQIDWIHTDVWIAKGIGSRGANVVGASEEKRVSNTGTHQTTNEQKRKKEWVWERANERRRYKGANKKSVIETCVNMNIKFIGITVWQPTIDSIPTNHTPANRTSQWASKATASTAAAAATGITAASAMATHLTCHAHTWAFLASVYFRTRYRTVDTENTFIHLNTTQTYNNSPTNHFVHRRVDLTDKNKQRNVNFFCFVQFLHS